MKSSTWKTVGLLVILVVAFGVLSAVWPSLVGRLGQSGEAADGVSLPSLETRDPGVLTVPLIDEPVNQWVVLAGMVVITLVFLGMVATALLGFFYLSSRQVTAVKEDSGYRTAVAAMESANKAFVKQTLTARPPTPIPPLERPRWSAISTALVIAFLSLVVGTLIWASFYPEDSLTGWALGSFVVGGLVSGLLLNANRLRAAERTDNDAIPWGLIWVVFTGVIVLGIGVGLIIWVRSAGVAG